MISISRIGEAIAALAGDSLRGLPVDAGERIARTKPLAKKLEWRRRAIAEINDKLAPAVEAANRNFNARQLARCQRAADRGEPAPEPERVEDDAEMKAVAELCKAPDFPPGIVPILTELIDDDYRRDGFPPEVKKALAERARLVDAHGAELIEHEDAKRHYRAARSDAAEQKCKDTLARANETAAAVAALSLALNTEWAIIR